METPVIRIGTMDSVTSLFLVKIRKMIDMETIAFMFGFHNKSTVSDWYHEVEDYIYQHGELLTMSRNLSNNNVLRQMLNELHQVTMRSERARVTYDGRQRAFEAANPGVGPH